MNKIVPLISSGTAGPLGVLHLPRLWLKISLAGKGLLESGYPAIGAGYDSMVLSALGLDPEATQSYIQSECPTYPQFEAWVLSQKGGSLDREAVEKLNSAIKGYNHDDATRKSILDGVGIADNGEILDAINLNNLDDWHEFHAAVLK